ncbi:MAG: hypothetical protein BLITH_0263 [Brockia lithotrophica]|uniref:DUF445 family protein n=1 Tax=Brockia lithotrophica TaxID=933949 RepID=A0A2T5GAG7_9BACL|nr:DUF445 family protein [Brockia lithotrophica]PTQ53183.1 MAG: hypothetical protein BLITH_0263 [Brockia lithotrophica]
MSLLWNAILLTAVGAFIGWATSAVAVWLIFRPHEPVYVGRVRVPLTPGVLPRHRGELGRALGELVEGTLLPERAIAARLEEADVRRLLQLFLLRTGRRAVAHLRAKEGSAAGASFFGLVPESRQELLRLWEDLAPDVAFHVWQGLLRRASSAEGYALVAEWTVRVLEEQGFVGRTVARTLREPIARSLHRAFVRYLASQGGREVVRQVVHQVVRDAFSDGGEAWSRDPILRRTLLRLLRREAPRLAALLQTALVRAVPEVYRALRPAELVEREVARIPMTLVEEAVRRIAHREIRAILVLGAALGAGIGILQVFFLR